MLSQLLMAEMREWLTEIITKDIKDDIKGHRRAHFVYLPSPSLPSWKVVWNTRPQLVTFLISFSARCLCSHYALRQPDYRQITRLYPKQKWGRLLNPSLSSDGESDSRLYPTMYLTMNLYSEIRFKWTCCVMKQHVDCQHSGRLCSGCTNSALVVCFGVLSHAKWCNGWTFWSFSGSL